MEQHLFWTSPARTARDYLADGAPPGSGLMRVIFEPWMPMPAIRPLGLKMNA